MAAPAAPVNVVDPPGPATPDNPILVDANDEVVTNLPWVNWQPAAAAGGMARVSLTQAEALSTFAIKCKTNRTPADLAAMGPINPITLRLTAAAWSKILTAVRDGGLAGRTLNILEELHAYIKSSVPLVAIVAIDWRATAPSVSALMQRRGISPRA